MGALRLRRFIDTDVDSLMGWFPDAAAVDRWSGPFFRFPFTPDSFREDLRLGAVDSWALVDEADGLIGFGQVYERNGRNHLGRIAVHPERRGCGIGHQLLAELMRAGAMNPGHDEFGLYVYPDNAAALHCYRSAGFVDAPDPDEHNATRGLNYQYMVANRSA